MPLITTPGAANANSYADVSEADAFMLGRPQSEEWTVLTTAQKEAALIWGTMLIDAVFQWTGSAVTDVQALCWPRNGMYSRNGFLIANNVIPNELKHAVSEYARQLASDDKASDNDPLKQGIIGLKAGSVELRFRAENQAQTTEMLNANIVLQGPDFFYLTKAVPDAVKMLIVPSWYTRKTTRLPLVFGVHR